MRDENYKVWSEELGGINISINSVEEKSANLKKWNMKLPNMKNKIVGEREVELGDTRYKVAVIPGETEGTEADFPIV